MHLQTGSETMTINRQFLLKTDSAEINSTKKYVYHKPGVRMESMYNRTFIVKKCAFGCIWKKMVINVTVKTKARTPFFLSGPEFGFVYSAFTSTTQSWLDAIITARSEQKSVTGMNCLEHYNVHESIFKKSNLFSKSVPSNSRKDSIFVNLVMFEGERPVQIRINVLTRSKLSKTKSTTTIDLNWTSVVSLSREISQKTVSLPGNLRSVTFKALNFVRSYTINVHYIQDVFSQNSYRTNNERFCHKDIMTTAKINYCLNHTSVQNSYLFFWNFTQYLQCYYVPPFFMTGYDRVKSWAEVGFTIPKNDKCPKQQSKAKVIKSWTEASKLCKSIGGYLPLIRNRDELDEILAFLKLSEDMPPVEGLYIGIQRSFRSQVTNNILSDFTAHVLFHLL